MKNAKFRKKKLIIVIKWNYQAKGGGEEG